MELVDANAALVLVGMDDDGFVVVVVVVVVIVVLMVVVVVVVVEVVGLTEVVVVEVVEECLLRDFKYRFNIPVFVGTESAFIMVG